MRPRDQDLLKQQAPLHESPHHRAHEPRYATPPHQHTTHLHRTVSLHSRFAAPFLLAKKFRTGSSLSCSESNSLTLIKLF